MKLIFLLCALFLFICSAPVYRLRERRSNGPPEKKSCLPKICFFSKLHLGDWETKERPEKSKVSSDCSEELIRLGDLFDYPVNSKTGERNAVELILCRGAGECDVDLTNSENRKKWENVEICENHADELLRKWDDSHKSYRNKHIYQASQGSSTTTKVCSMPEGVERKHAKRPHDRLETLKIQGSDAIGKELGLLVHPGIPVCNHHADYARNLIKKQQANPRKRTGTEFSYSRFLEDNSCDRDPDYLLPKSGVRSETATALLQLAKKVGVERVCFPRKAYSDLEGRTQQKKSCAVRKLIDVIIGIVAPEDTVNFKKSVMGTSEDESWTTGSSKNIDSIMKQVAAQFFVAEDRINKLIVLSLIANSISYSKVEKYIPNLSLYMYSAARKFARRDRDSKVPVKKLEKYNPLAVQNFVAFITSPTVMIGLPYGTRKVKMAGGVKHEIPNSIRQQSAAEIFDMYSNLVKETNEPHLKLSKSSVYRILEVCAATTRKATTCVDYFIANGMDAFEALHDIVDTWLAEELTDYDSLKKLKTSLFESSQYLRTDYRLHVKNFSRVADHCATFALSDPADQKLSSSCSVGLNNHKHDLKCDRCELVKNTLEQLKSYAEDFSNDAEKTGLSAKNKEVIARRKEERELIGKNIERISEMKKHFLRVAVTSIERTEIIDKLKDNEALLTLDFAQKFLPKWHRERQSDYFGKKGINYHITHVTARIGDKNAQHSFVHIYDREVTQDSGLVVLTIAHVAEELKKVGITRISLRSDNAGAYHCASTISSLHWLSETTGVMIDTYTFSEAQNGKSSSDRDANRVKRKAESYVSRGNDITTAEQFFDAMKEGKVLNGVSVHYGSVSIEKTQDAKWPGIANLNHFTLEPNGIRGRRYGSLGEGHFVPKNELKPLTGRYKFEGAGFLATDIDSIDNERKAFTDGLRTKFWYFSECAKTASSDASGCVDEQDDVTPELDDFAKKNAEVIGTLYSCPEPGCSSTFLTHRNLEKHVLRGKHKVSPEKLTMRDLALKLFVQQLEEVEQTRVCPIVGDALDELKESSEETDLQRGWALPQKQKRKPFEEDVKKFLFDCFEEGLKHPGSKKLNPRTVEKRMTTEKKSDGSLRFTVAERKDFRQIAGYFSREAERRRSLALRKRRAYGRHRRAHGKHHHRRHRRADNKKSHSVEPYKKEYVVPDEEHDDVGWIRFLKDEGTFTAGDEYYEALMENEEPLFDYQI